VASLRFGVDVSLARARLGHSRISTLRFIVMLEADAGW
jgi:hypothetical protein